MTKTGNEDLIEAPEVPKSHVVIVDSTNLKQVLNENKYVLLAATAEFCGHCKAMKPELA